MFKRRHDTGLTLRKAVWVCGIGDSKGESVEWRVKACFQVKVEPPAMFALYPNVRQARDVKAVGN